MPFWLKVRKEYIYDNFDAMVEYIKRYGYDSGSTTTADYDATLDCLRDIVADIERALDETPMYAPLPAVDHADRALPLMGVTLLAAHKRGDTLHDVLLTLTRYILRSEIELDDSVCRQLWRVIAACARGQSVLQYGFSYDILVKWSNTYIPLLAHQIAATQFKHIDKNDVVHDIEHHGLLTLHANNIVDLMPMNRAAALRSKTSTLLDLPGMVTVSVPAGEVSGELTFDSLLAETRSINRSLPGITASPVARLKDYSRDDIFVIRITSRSGVRVTAETVDPRYNRLEGKVLMLWNTKFRPDGRLLTDMLGSGDFVLATLAARTGDFTFEVGPALDDAYDHMVDGTGGEKDIVMFHNDIPEGSLWVSADGLRVIVHRSKYPAENDDRAATFSAAHSGRMALPIVYYAQAPDTSRSEYKLYAQPDIDIYDTTPAKPFLSEDSDRRFFRYFIEDATSEATGMSIARESLPVPRAAALTMAQTLLYMSLHEETGALNRLKYLSAAAVMASVIGDDLLATFVNYQIDLLERLVAFSHNSEMRPLAVPDTLHGDARVEATQRLLQILHRYIVPGTRETGLTVSTGAEEAGSREHRISTLVTASNNLRDIVGHAELGNIKLAITRLLGTDDEYMPDSDGRTSYGNEGQTLEFKSSVVFTPVNRRPASGTDANPDTQRWAILKAVCGMLNSRTGGEILLGVNDSGFPSDLTGDINELYRLKRIPSADIDHYRLYVQHLFDGAFKEFGAQTQSYDIVALNVSTVIEDNAEQRPVLRIQVRPYPYGVVGFADDLARPFGYSASYVRRDGRTIPVTDKIMQEIGRYKLEGDSVARNIIMLSKACDGHQLVCLRGYRSGSGINDRTLEVYKVWKKQGLVYGYDVERKAPRLFKVRRAASVEVLDRQWTTPHGALDADIDPFGMMLDSTHAYNVTIALTEYGKLLLEETVPSAKVTANRREKDFVWRYDARVSSPEGIGRFILGIPGQARVLQGDPVKSYLAHMTRLIADNLD